MQSYLPKLPLKVEDEGLSLGGQVGLEFSQRFYPSARACPSLRRLWPWREGRLVIDSFNDGACAPPASIAAPCRDSGGRIFKTIECSCSGWPTGNGQKLSSTQEQLGQATCLAVA